MAGKAQVSLEYLVITGFMLLIAGLIFLFALFSFNENSRVAQAEGAVSAIVNSANHVASLGDGSRVPFEVSFPEGAEILEFRNKAVRLRVSSGTGSADVIGYAKAGITPSTIAVTRGRKTMSAAFTDGNVVITDAS